MRRGRCCCDNATIWFRTAMLNANPHGRVKLWNDVGDLVADATPDADGFARVNLPSPTVTGWKVEISEVPRCDALTINPASLSTSYIALEIRIGMNPSASSGLAYVAPSIGYGLIGSIDYPQTCPLDLIDSDWGTLPLDRAGGGSGTHYRNLSGTFGAGTYKRFIMGPDFVGGAFTPNNVAVAFQEQTAITPLTVRTATAEAVATSVWTPDAGGTFSWSYSGTRWGAAYNQSVDE